MNERDAGSSPPEWLSSLGETGRLIRASVQAASALGKPGAWPAQLHTLLRLILVSRQPMFLIWGARQVWFHNDAFIPIAGRKHPEALGRNALDVWSEAREALAPLFDQVYAGVPVQMDDIALMLDRRGRLEEAHFAFSYTPVLDDRGTVAGLFGTCIETTELVLLQRYRAAEAGRLRQMFEQAPSFMCLLRGPEHRFEFVNNAHRKLFRSAGWIGKPILEALPAAVQQGFGDLLDRVYASGERHVGRAMPLRIERADGSVEELRLDFVYEPMREEDGSVSGIFCEGFDVTDIFRSEQAAKDSETRFREFADAAPVLMWASDPNGHCTWFNRRWFDFTGRALADELGTGWTQSVHPDDRARCLSVRCSSHEPFRVDYQLRRADGAWRLVRDSGVPRFSADGVFIGFIGSCVDITEERAAEETLRRREEQLRLATDAAEIGLWDVDLVNDELYWPARVKAMFGIAPETPVSMHDFYAGLHPDDKAAVAANFAAACDPERRSTYDVEYRTIGRNDGVIRWVAAKGKGVFDDTGRCVRVIGTAIDISARKRTEQRLRELMETLERQVAERTLERDRMWRYSRDLLVVVGADGVFRAVNPAWTRVLGHDVMDVIGHSFRSFIWPEDAAATEAALADAAMRTEVVNFENRYRHKDGSVRWISWNTSVESDVVYAFGRDVTTQKEQERALRATEEQLRQSQKMEAVGQLTGGLAHDFNNLLAAIGGSLEMLATRIAQGRASECERYISTAQTAATRAAALTHRMLAFSRRQTLAPRVVRVNRLVDDIVDLIRRTVGPEIEVAVAAAPDTWPTSVDVNQLENSLINLCINARDAMPGGGVLTITMTNCHFEGSAAHSCGVEPGDYVALAVTDTGSGMTADVCARAFDPFFTTKPIGAGTGLGLSMVYGFAKQSGGHVRIESDVKSGTTVSLYLPRSLDEESYEASAPAARLPRAGEGQRILLVDDESGVRLVTGDALKQIGYDVIEASDGAHALQAMRAQPDLDLLVTDVGLPGGINGRQLADACRELQPSLKVLFITGYAEDAIFQNGALPAGMEVLTKPFNLVDLANRVRAILDATVRSSGSTFA